MKPNHGSRGCVDGDEERGFRFLLSEKRKKKEGTRRNKHRGATGIRCILSLELKN